MQVTVNNPAFNYYYSALPLPVLRDSRLKDRDRRLLAAFYFFAGKTNCVYNKTRKEIGHIAGMAEDVVTLISARLQKFGWVKKSGNGGRSQSAVYELTVPETFTHLQRSTNQICRAKTTKQPLTPIPSNTRHTANTMLASSKELPTPTSERKPIPQANKYTLSQSLIYPNGLDQAFANALLVQLPDSQQQVALDEWLGQINSYRERSISVHSPNGLFRTIVKALLAGNSVQHASLVKQRRERAQMIASAIEQPAQKNEGTEQSTSPAKRFAPGELKAKLMAEIGQRKQKIQEQKPILSTKKTSYPLEEINDENLPQLIGGLNKKPTKNIKTTTTVNSENNGKVKEHTQKSGGGNLELNSNSIPNSTTNQKTGSVGLLADRQSQQWSFQTKLTSSCGFMDEPTAQLVGRGQLKSCPPRQLSPTSSTRLDVLWLPKKINSIFPYLLTTSVHKKGPFTLDVERTNYWKVTSSVSRQITLPVNCYYKSIEESKTCNV